MIVGHRGAAALAPENTLSAVIKAHNAGATWVEIDTQLTADGVPVVFHDETLDRCTDGSGKLSNYDLQSLQQLDAGSWFGLSFMNERVPTLDALLTLCLERGISINVEVKIHDDSQITASIEKIADVILKHKIPNDMLLLSSFSVQAVSECQRLLPNIRRGVISEEKSPDFLNELNSLDLYSIHMDHKVVTPDMAKTIKDKGYVLNVWTMNEPEKVPFLTEIGVDNIITDNPELF